MITDRQLLTIKHLKDRGTTTPLEIAAWCSQKITESRQAQHKVMTGRRKHSKAYYQEILNYIAQGGAT